jgi:hypothetical protein
METQISVKPKFDLGTNLDTRAACNAGAVIDILDTHQNKTGVKITVLGKDSDAFREMQRENIDAAKRRAHLARQKNKPIPVQTQAEEEAEGIRLLVACTLGWENMTVDGKDLEFNVPNALMVYERFPEVMRQVDAAIGDLELFTRA